MEKLTERRKGEGEKTRGVSRKVERKKGRVRSAKERKEGFVLPEKDRKTEKVRFAKERVHFAKDRKKSLKNIGVSDRMGGQGQ